MEIHADGTDFSDETDLWLKFPILDNQRNMFVIVHKLNKLNKLNELNGKLCFSLFKVVNNYQKLPGIEFYSLLCWKL